MLPMKVFTIESHTVRSVFEEDFTRLVFEKIKNDESLMKRPGDLESLARYKVISHDGVTIEVRIIFSTNGKLPMISFSKKITEPREYT
ncbi:MAG: hypothetical protein JW885_13500 [Deltaproteobacteria bacterium]|nr:hypothetical protein [Candidatus Zymogenaceae bacterium]